MRPENLASGIKTILEHSPAFPKAKLIVDIIANPKAGGFKRRRFADKRKKELAALVAESLQLPQRKSPVSVHLHLTERGGHAAAIVQRLLDRSESNGTDLLHLIITAGGDGTSLETAERLTHLPERKRTASGFCDCRLERETMVRKAEICVLRLAGFSSLSGSNDAPLSASCPLWKAESPLCMLSILQVSDWMPMSQT